ncbi:Drebrin, partial [Ophiophagus hannah]
MAGVSFSVNRLELLASYQEVIGEDSPTDWPSEALVKSLEATPSQSNLDLKAACGSCLLTKTQHSWRLLHFCSPPQQDGDVTSGSEVEVNPVLCFELDLPLFLLIYYNVFEAAHIISTLTAEGQLVLVISC